MVNAKLPVRLEKLRLWDNAALPPALKARILREFERWRLVGEQIGSSSRSGDGRFARTKARRVNKHAD